MRSIAEIIEHRRLDEIHECAVPGCGARARFAYYVDLPMRLAARDWAVGDLIDMCVIHDRELRTVAQDAKALGYDLDEDTRIAMGLIFGPPEQNPLDRLREWKKP